MESESMRRAVGALDEALRRLGHDQRFRPLRAEQLPELHPDPPQYSPPLLDWYAIGAPLGIRVPWIVEELVLYDPVNLAQAQAGYRYDARRPGPILRGWSPSWIVIGDLLADPLIVDANDAGGAVSIARHGRGAFRPLVVAESIPRFLHLLACWVDAFRTSGGRPLDEDCVLRSDVLAGFVDAALLHVSGEQLRLLSELFPLPES